MEKSVDFLGQEMSEGDEVVFMQLNYRNLMKGKIIGITPHKVKISHGKTNVGGTVSYQDKLQVIKISDTTPAPNTVFSMLDLLKPALDSGCTFELYTDEGIICIDLHTGAKSGCVVKIENGEYVAYRRYNRRDVFTDFDELVSLVHDCGHGRSYFSNDWLKVFLKMGYSDPRGNL